MQCVHVTVQSEQYYIVRFLLQLLLQKNLCLLLLLLLALRLSITITITLYQVIFTITITYYYYPKPVGKILHVLVLVLQDLTKS